MLRKFSPIVALLLLVAGCAALGVPAADTFNKKVVSANAIIESAAETNQTLVIAGKVSKDEGQKIHDQLVTLAHGIDISREVYKTNPQDAQNRLAVVIVALNELQVYLESKQ